jgi:hypothetical protein
MRLPCLRGFENLGGSLIRGKIRRFVLVMVICVLVNRTLNINVIANEVWQSVSRQDTDCFGRNPPRGDVKCIFVQVIADRHDKTRWIGGRNL